MSRLRDPLAQCEGKHRHLTAADASREAGVRTKRLRTYKCPWCGFWHTSGRANLDPRDTRAERLRRQERREARTEAA